MSRLYASIESDSRKTPATSRGHRHVEAHVRGWENGVRVVARTEDENDIFDVFTTGGSNGVKSDIYVGTVSHGIFIPRA